MRQFLVALVMAAACFAGAVALGAADLAALGLAAVPLVLGIVAVRVELAYLFGSGVFIMGMVNLAFPFTAQLSGLLQRLTP